MRYWIGNTEHRTPNTYFYTKHKNEFDLYMRMTLNWKTFGILGYMYECIYSEDAFIEELDCILLVKYMHNFTMAMFLAHNIRFTSYRFDVHFSFVNKLVWLQKCFILHLPRFFFIFRDPYIIHYDADIAFFSPFSSNTNTFSRRTIFKMLLMRWTLICICNNF